MKTIDKLFLALVGISSSSGEEVEMAEYIKEYLIDSKWRVWQDDAGKKVGGNCGNLYAYWEVKPEYETVVLCAHMDTVIQPGEKVQVQRKGDWVLSDGSTILGADNRAGIAAILGLALSLEVSKLKVNVLLFFPVHEEIGKMGSSLFCFSKPVKAIFNVDESMPVGNFVYSSLCHLSFGVEVQGKSAHAAKDYDKGVNAIVVAAELVLKMKLGVDEDEGWTMNIGAIHGGSKTNVVPDNVKMKGEVRSYSEDVLKTNLKKLEEVIAKIEKRTKAKISVEYEWVDYVPPFEGGSDELQEICRVACDEVGLEAKFARSWSSSDANCLAFLGHDVISVARGGKNPHSKEETIKMSSINQTRDLLEKILYLC